MRLKAFARAVLDREFTVEEKPVAVYLPPGESGSQEDLAALATKVLLDNDRLADLNEDLRAKASQARPGELDKLFRNLLPTLDSFDRLLNLARSHPPSEEVDNWLKSIETIYYRLLSLLEQYEFVQLKTIGRTVDLNLHEVVEYRQSAEHPSETVIAERQKGYVFRGKLVRDAKVVVAFNDSKR